MFKDREFINNFQNEYLITFAVLCRELLYFLPNIIRDAADGIPTQVRGF